MGLVASKSLPNGSSGNYWVITKASVDYIGLTASFVLSLYADQAHSDSGAPSLGPKYVFNGSFSAQDLTGNILQLGYNLIQSVLSNPQPSFNLNGTSVAAWNDLNGATYLADASEVGISINTAITANLGAQIGLSKQSIKAS